MKRSLIVLFILVMASVVGAATLKWDASVGTVEGYIVNYGTVEGEYPYTFNVGNVTTLENMEAVLHLHPGVPYFLGMSAYNDSDESNLSNIITYTRPAYVLPDDNLPSIVIEIPEPPDQLILNFTH